MSFRVTDMDTFIQKLAVEAGSAVLKRFGKDGAHYTKSERIWDVVTKADLLSERIIISRIKKKLPEHGIISEESGEFNKDAEYVWIIDPIDGTLNFSNSIPMFGVMICLTRKGNVILSAVNLPATGELFFAKAGKGAYVNGKRIRCSQLKSLHNSSGCSTVATGKNGKREERFVKNILKLGARQEIHLGSFGSCANECYVAAGRKDWTVSLAGKIWDFAPTYLILKEAGCKVTDTRGRPWKLGINEMVAANPTLHKEVLKLTRNI